MKLDPVLLDILVCPDCKGSLTVDDAAEELICDSCGLIYPVRDDIPVMLVDEARRPGPTGDGAAAGTAEPASAAEPEPGGDRGSDDDPKRSGSADDPASG